VKKLINDPENFVDEVVEGILLAHPEELRSATEDNRALVRMDAGTSGRVGIVTGGGSGHLPFFLGYVGQGLCSGVGVGNVFSSPSSEQLYEATKASDDGAGVLYLYGNYGGDVYNFDLAGDLAEGDGIRTTTVIGTDDILSAPEEREKDRRGVAGLIFAYKTAGAAAERGDDLDKVTETAQRTVDRSRTMGVGLAPTILPAAGEPTFTLEDGEMEVGIGIHGEPGHHRGKLETADEVTDRFLKEIRSELKLGKGDKVALIVNGLGATPLEELYLIYRRVHQDLAADGVEIHRHYIGELVTSLEMAGASLSILHLDDELTELIDAPAHSPFFSQRGDELGAQNAGKAPKATPSAAKKASNAQAGAREIQRTPNPGPLKNVLIATANAMPQHAEELRQLDSALGDGDLGITISTGAKAVRAAVADLPDDAHPSEILRTAGQAFATANPSTYAALFGGGLISAAAEVKNTDQFTLTEATRALDAFQNRIMERGGAEVGDKTFVDAIDAVRKVLHNAGQGTPSSEVLTRAVDAADHTVEEGKNLISRRGRAGWIADRSQGKADPGSVAFLRIVQELARAVTSG